MGKTLVRLFRAKGGLSYDSLVGSELHQCPKLDLVVLAVVELLDEVIVVPAEPVGPVVGLAGEVVEANGAAEDVDEADAAPADEEAAALPFCELDALPFCELDALPFCKLDVARPLGSRK